MAQEIFHFNLGNLKCITFNEMIRESPVDQMYTSVPEEERIAVLNEFDLDGKIPSALNVLLINTNSEKILIDTGLGALGTGALYDGLTSENVACEEIDHIIITHGHGDHIGGIIDVKDKLVFPNAHYWIGKTEYDSWSDTEYRTYAIRKRVNDAIPVDRLHIVTDENEFLPGFSLIPLPGHCVGMMGVIIESAGERAVHIADVMHHVIQVKYTDWCVNFDENQQQARQSRWMVFQRASDENLLVISYHVWNGGRGRITTENDSFSWEFQT